MLRNIKVRLKNMNIFKKTLSNLINTKDKIRETFSNISFNKKLSNDDFESIEECLLEADVSWSLVEKIIDYIKNNKSTYNDWESLLIESIKNCISTNQEFSFKKIIIMIGVNGSGKTTTSAKLAKMFKNSNKTLTLVAADTFRAAAIDQLKIWAERINVNFVSNINSKDPASIAYDGANSGLKNEHDFIIIDTAGRLHTSLNLMKELEKVYRIVSKLTNEISVIMTLDANIGQNAIKQVKEFNKFIPVDSVIINKMDGTAKGGVVLSILDELNLPVSFVGVGETYDDIVSFNVDDFLNSIIK